MTGQAVTNFFFLVTAAFAQWPSTVRKLISFTRLVFIYSRSDRKATDMTWKKGIKQLTDDCLSFRERETVSISVDVEWDHLVPLSIKIAQHQRESLSSGQAFLRLCSLPPFPVAFMMSSAFSNCSRIELLSVCSGCVCLRVCVCVCQIHQFPIFCGAPHFMQVIKTFLAAGGAYGWSNKISAVGKYITVSLLPQTYICWQVILKMNEMGGVLAVDCILPR